MEYRTLWVVRHVMPEDRLVHAQISEDHEIMIKFELRHGYIHRALTRTIALSSEGLSSSGLFDLDLSRVRDRPDIQAWFEPVEDKFTDQEPLKMYYGGRVPVFFEFLVRRDMVDPALVRELNEHVLPDVVGLLSLKNLADHPDFQ